MKTITLIIIAIALLGLAVAGIAIKMFFIKGGTFQKHCSSENPGKKEDCACCENEKKCSYRPIHHPIDTIVEED